MNFECHLCSYTTDSIPLLHVHCINAHPREFFTCPWCTIPFGSLRTLQKHTKNCPQFNTNEPREGEINNVLLINDKCLVCEGRFVSPEAAIKHYKEQHLNYSYICDVCEMYFKHNSNLDVHYAESHRMSSSDQIHCGMSSPPPSISTETSKDKGAPMKRTIIRNGSMTLKRQAMKFLRDKHCCVCKIDFATVDEIVGHFKVQHDTVVFACDDCDSAYMQNGSLLSHRRTKHPGNKKGNERVTRMTSATGNETQTSNQQPIKCPMCQFQTPSPVLFAAHVMGHQIKSENENGSAKIKRELIDDWIPPNERPPPTDGGFVDLTDFD